MTFSTDEQDYPRITPAVQWLIAISVAIYFVQLTFVGADDMMMALGFQKLNLFDRPWTILSYVFVHGGLLHLGLNMYSLWLFGPRVERAWSPGGFTRYYLWCGLGGWLAHMVFTRGGAGLVGASAAVYGVMLVYAMRWPDDEIYLFGLVPLKVKWLVIMLGVLDLASGIRAEFGGVPVGTAYLAHVGGLFFGWLYVRTQAVGSIEKLRQRMSQLPDVSDEIPRAIPRSQPRPRERDRGQGAGGGGGQEIDEIVARSNAMVTKRSALSPTFGTKVGKQKSEALNHVLDKISEQGIDSLTGDERRLLEEMSKKLRDR